MWKNKIFNTVVCVVISFAIGNIVFAYDSQTTHSNLTDITVELYNYQTNNKILQSEKYWIKKGSMDEDKGTRSINHFYDPVYNRTWKLGGVEGLLPEVTSRIWVNDQARQSSYDIPFLASLRVMSKSYLESPANQTYDKAIYEYIKGNKKDAFYSLGHVLHLLQDLTSVPHTRADAHMGADDGSSYEIMSAYKTVDEFRQLYESFKNKSIVKRSNIEDYFFNVALYTNNNFYSEDTIMSSDYLKPEIFQKSAVTFSNGQDDYYVLGWDSEIQNVYKLAKKIGRDWKVSDWLKKYDVNDPLVFEDYWSRLSKKAVLEGAGLIDLFFKDVEKKKNDSAFLAMMEEKHGVSFFEKAIGNANLLFNYILGLNKPVEDVVVNKTNTSSTAVDQNNYSTTTNTKTASSVTTKSTNSIATTKPKTTTTTKITTTTKPKTTTTTKPKTTTTTKPQNLASKCNFVFGFLNQSIYNKKVIFNEIAWMGNKNNYTKEWIEIKNVSNEKIDISSWEIINTNKSVKIVVPEKTILNPYELYFLERTDDDTVLHVRADLIYVGAIKNDNEEMRILDGNCLLVDEVKAIPNWPAGDNGEKRTMERANDLSWYTSSGSCINGVCGTPKAENSQFVQSFNTPSNSSGGTSGGMTTTTTTTTQPQGSTTTTTTTTRPEVVTEQKRIVFSEIKISGATANDEFVELYNPLDEDVDLAGWSIKQKTTSKENLISGEYLNGKTIPSKGYFLITSKKEGAYRGVVAGDTTFNSDSYSLLDNQALILYDNFDREIDRVGWGEGRISSDDCENACLQNILVNQSFERKANVESTVETMVAGIDRLAGNGYDSQNNLNDFVTRENSDPQNSFSQKEPREEDADDDGEEKGNFDGSVALNNFSFYYDSPLKDRAFIEFDVDKYPFWNLFDESAHDSEFGQDDKWRAMVFYLNNTDNKVGSLSDEKIEISEGLNTGWQVKENEANVLLLRYDVCGGEPNDFYGLNSDASLILPYNIDINGNQFACNGENTIISGNQPSALAYNFSKGNHFKIEVIGVMDDSGNKNYDIKEFFKNGDFLTIGLYKGILPSLEGQLNETELIYEDPSIYNFDEDGFYKIEKPEFVSLEFDTQEHQYVLTWKGQKNDDRINYVVHGAPREELIGKHSTFSGKKIKDGDNWKMNINVEGVLLDSANIFFAIFAYDKNEAQEAVVSDILSIANGESSKKIDWYMKNVEWKFEEINGEKRMVLEFDFNRPSKYLNSLDESHYWHTLIPLWGYLPGSNVEFDFSQFRHVGSPGNYLTVGGLADEIRNFNNNARIVLGVLRTGDWGHKKFIIKEMKHPDINSRVAIRNENGITINDLMPFVKTEANPTGVINNLSDLYLVMSYGMRYESYPGYWVYTGDYQSFTPETDSVGNQIRHYLKAPTLEEISNPQ